MRVSIPVMGEKGLDEDVGSHFGKSNAYVIFDSESGAVTTIRNTSEHLGGVGLPPEILAEHDVNIVICSSLGPKAVQMLTERNIKTYVGARGSVRKAIDSWQKGELRLAGPDNVCREHGH
jgi:predicted Fe-Mo cluster-binding NifX family protein